MKTGAEDDGVADELVSELLATGELSMGGTLASDPSGRLGDSEGDSRAVSAGRGGSGRKKKKKGTTFSASPSNPGKK